MPDRKTTIALAFLSFLGVLATATIPNVDKISQFWDWCCVEAVTPPKDGQAMGDNSVPPLADSPPVSPPTGGVILFGSESSLAPAKASLQEAQAKGFSGGIILFKYNRYRPGLVFPTVDAANAKLGSVKSQLESSSYIRDLSRWCPTPQGGSAGFWTCENNGVF